MQRRWLNVRKGLLRSIMPLLRLLPPRAASRLVTRIGRIEYALLPRLRTRYDRAVARAGRDLGGGWDVAEVGRALAGNQIRWRARDLLLDGLPDGHVAPLFGVEGRAELDAALQAGRGVILLGNHFGAHMMPAHWLVRNGYPLRLFMERPRHVSRFLTRYFESDGPLGQSKLFISRRATPAEAAGSIMRAARILKAGLIVNLAGDVRWSGTHTARARFLGHDYTFSSTWVALAALSGAPVVQVFCRMEPGGAYHLEFLPPFRVPPNGTDPDQADRWVQKGLAAVEDRVRLDPTNSNDYFFWPDAAAASPAA